MTVAVPPVAQFVLMSAAGVLISRLLPRAAAVPAAAGAAVMALGIFGLAALQEMPLLRPIATQPLAIASLVVWAALAVAHGVSLRNGVLWRDTARPIGTFAIGCWVAATAVLLELIVLAVPEWRPLALLLGSLAAAIWLWFLKIVAEDVRAVVRSASRELVPGVVLLSTVGTQSLALAALALFPEGALRPLAEVLIALGGLMYLAGFVVVVWSHVRAQRWTLADDWDNTNCILHGAMSITGLAVVSWGTGSPGVALALWLYVLAVFVVVEAVEIARLVARVAAYGWRRGAFVYRVSQWSRNFTFGMFYAFTLALAQRIEFPAGWSWVGSLQHPVLTVGPYLVLALLLIEIALLLRSRWSAAGRVRSAPAP